MGEKPGKEIKMTFNRIGFVKSMSMVAVVSAFCFAAYGAPEKKLNFVLTSKGLAFLFLNQIFIYIKYNLKLFF